MKFVCLNCETYMSFEKVEKPAEGSLGVFFACPACDVKVSMVTNPGETQMVSSLGVQLGGRTVDPSPLEMTRGTLKEDVGDSGRGGVHGGLSERKAPRRTEREPRARRNSQRRRVRQLSVFLDGRANGVDERRVLLRHATGRASMEPRRARTVG